MLFWDDSVDPDETALYTVDWTAEMDVASDTLAGTPTFVVVGTTNGVTFASITITGSSKKVTVLVSNSDPSTNRVAVLAGSPYTITHTVATTAGQTLVKTLGLRVAEDGSDLVVTVSGALSDAYDTLVNADAYHSARGNSGWTGTDNDRVQMLRRGTSALDAQFLDRLKGHRTTSGQALAWSRNGMTDEDGNYIASDTIPTDVKHASFEMSRIVTAVMTVEEGKRIKSAGAGSARVVFAGAHFAGETLDYINRLMLPYLHRSNILRQAP